MSLVRYRLADILGAATVLLLAVAAWFLFAPAHVGARVQVTADRVTWHYPSFCGQATLTHDQQLQCAVPSSATWRPGRKETEAIACVSAWSQWIGHVPYRQGTGTFANLTGELRPATAVFSSPSEANALCGIASRGRVHLFWTLTVLAGVALIGVFVALRWPSLE